MKIGLAISYYRSNYTIEVCQYLSNICRQHGHSLYIFEGRYFANQDKSRRTQNSIYRLISGKRLDGVICGTATMISQADIDANPLFFQEMGIPAVSLGTDVVGIPSVTANNTTGMEQLTRHMLDHQYKRFAYITGPAGNDESTARERAFLNVLAEAGISILPEHLIQGDFSVSGGYSAAVTLAPIISRGELDAVVCANDDTAFGLMNALQERGMSIPKQVAITGYDNSIPSWQYTPLLTTVSPKLEQAIDLSMSLLENLIAGKDVQTIVVNSELIVRETCRCSIQAGHSGIGTYKAAEAEYYKLYEHMQSFDLHQYLNELDDCLASRHIQNFFVVTFSEPVHYKDYSTFSFPENARVIFARTDNRRRTATLPLFETKLILPDQFIAEEHLSWIIKPIFYVDDVYGYTVANTNLHDDGLLDDARYLLGQIIKTTHLFDERMHMEYRLKEALEELRGTNKRLSDLSLSDELTGLYNRRGFLKYAGEYFAQTQASCLVVYADMDGLKYINDHYGHEEGDFALKAVSRILSECMRERDILSRQGGDEFLLLFKDADPSHGDMLSRRFTDKLMIANQILEKPYELSFSWGIVCGTTDNDLEKLMRSADDLMLERKRLKKSKRAD